MGLVVKMRAMEMMRTDKDLCIVVGWSVRGARMYICILLIYICIFSPDSRMITHCVYDTSQTCEHVAMYIM